MMLKLNKEAVIRFKSLDIDLSDIAFGILQDKNINLVEIFRLEGRKQPLIRNTIFTEYCDTTFQQIYNMWNLHHRTYSKLPNIEDIETSSLVDIAANLRIFRTDHNFECREYDIYNYIETGAFKMPKVDLLTVLRRSKSVIALFYYCMIYASSISRQPLHSVHYSRDKNGIEEPWLTMILPYASNTDNKNDNYLMLQKRI